MPLIIGKIKCYFCEKAEGVMYSVHDYGIYDQCVKKRIFYHPECLELVELNPTSGNSLMIDKALHIIDLRNKNHDRFNSEIVFKYEKKLERLREANFDRMAKGTK